MQSKKTKTNLSFACLTFKLYSKSSLLSSLFLGEHFLAPPSEWSASFFGVLALGVSNTQSSHAGSVTISYRQQRKRRREPTNKAGTKDFVMFIRCYFTSRRNTDVQPRVTNKPCYLAYSGTYSTSLLLSAYVFLEQRTQCYNNQSWNQANNLAIEKQQSNYLNPKASTKATAFTRICGNKSTIIWRICRASEPVTTSF